MNHTLEKAALIATFVGGISGLWYILEQSTRLTRRLARSTTASGAALPRPRRSTKVTSLFAVVFGVSFAAFFASDTNNASWCIGYIGVAMLGGAATSYLVEDANADTFLGFLRHLGWTLLSALLCSTFAAMSALYLLPHATAELAGLAGYVSDQPMMLPRYITPLIGAISGIAGGFYSPLGSKYLRLSLMFAQAIAASVSFAAFLTVPAVAYFSEHRPGFALVFLVATLLMMFFPLLLRDSE